jgi:hypothetical protein
MKLKISKLSPGNQRKEKKALHGSWCHDKDRDCLAITNYGIVTQITTWWQEQTICHWHKVTQGFIEYKEAEYPVGYIIGRICQTLCPLYS